MSVNLMIRTGNKIADQAETNWATIQEIAQNEQGIVTIDDETVASIARLVADVTLTNGDTVRAYNCEHDDSATFVPAFNPSLLPELVQDQMRDRLAAGENSKHSVALFNEVLRQGLTIALQGTEKGMFDEFATLDAYIWAQV